MYDTIICTHIAVQNLKRPLSTSVNYIYDLYTDSSSIFSLSVIEACKPINGGLMGLRSSFLVCTLCTDIIYPQIATVGNVISTCLIVLLDRVPTWFFTFHGIHATWWFRIHQMKLPK